MNQSEHSRHSGELETDVGLDALFHILSNSQRRKILEYLAQREDEAVKRRELVEMLCPEAGMETEREVSTLREQLHINLHHLQLPLLDESGIVDYDPQAETVEYQENPGFEHLMSSLRKQNKPTG